jgi:hypothetical protein
MAALLGKQLKGSIKRSIRDSLTGQKGGGGGGGFDAAAAAYIAAVEAADGQSLEAGVKTAINTFVVGCKADGIWNAIKASCILAGARTLSGALVPLAGTAPTNNNFVSGDYDRKTGLAGNGNSTGVGTKYLNTNRLSNADPQDNFHNAVFVSTATSGQVSAGYAGVRNNTSPYNGDCSIGVYTGGATPFIYLSNRSSDSTTFVANNQHTATGLIGSTRNLAASYVSRVNQANYSFASTSFTPVNFNAYVFARNQANSPIDYINARLAFYSIGESLDLALLDARVTTLINSIGLAVQDPYYANVSLLLHGDGTNGSTTIIDNSPTPKTVTAVGNAQISTAQSKFGGSSIAFDGNADYLTIPDSADWNLPNDFTIEAWVYLTAYSANNAGYFGAVIVSQYTAAGGGSDLGWQLRINGTASSYTTINLYTGVTDLNFAATVSLNTWTHVAVTRSGSSIRAFVNGTQAGSTITNSDAFTESGNRQLWIGGLNDTTYRFWLPGYIDDLRITKGVARYTANFIPPAAPFPNS